MNITINISFIFSISKYSRLYLQRYNLTNLYRISSSIVLFVRLKLRSFCWQIRDKQNWSITLNYSIQSFSLFIWHSLTSLVYHNKYQQSIILPASTRRKNDENIGRLRMYKRFETQIIFYESIITQFKSKFFVLLKVF